MSDSPELELQKSSCHVGARKTNLGLLEEQQVPLTAEPSLSPHDGLTRIPLKPQSKISFLSYISFGPVFYIKAVKSN